MGASVDVEAQAKFEAGLRNLEVRLPKLLASIKGANVAIEAEIDKVLAANADKVAEYRDGKDKLFGFFVGQTMKAMQGKANPQVVNERLRAKLD